MKGLLTQVLPKDKALLLNLPMASGVISMLMNTAIDAFGITDAKVQFIAKGMYDNATLEGVNLSGIDNLIQSGIGKLFSSVELPIDIEVPVEEAEEKD